MHAASRTKRLQPKWSDEMPFCLKPWRVLSTLQVGDFQWPLEKATPCLRSDDHTYTFAMSAGDTGPMFYCVILPKGEACLAVVAHGSANAKAAKARFFGPVTTCCTVACMCRSDRGGA